jgi:glycosyltransferase involved in cell wall biosynthesis
MRRILHIIDSLGYNGAASQLLILSKALSQAGIDVHVCSVSPTNPRREEFEAASIPTVVIPRRWILDPLADWKLYRLLRHLQPDVVHTWNTVPGIFGPIAAGRRLIAGTYRIDRWRPSWETAIERRLNARAVYRVTNSEAVRAWAAHADSQRINWTIIPSGIGPPRPSDIARHELLRELHLPQDARLIGVVGELVPQKRVKDLIWAADLLRVLHNNLRLLIIGDGPLRSQLEDYTRLASDREHIRFLGAGNDVWRIMPHFDVLWNASENIGQSAAILEAMALGIPVVASDTPSNRELVVPIETGYLIPLATRSGRATRARVTDRIFTEPELAARLAKNAQDRALWQFSVATTLQKHLELYQLS